MMIDQLSRQDQRIVGRMAAAAGSEPEDMALEIVRSYLGLVRSAPEALPNDPLAPLAARAFKRGG